LGERQMCDAWKPPAQKCSFFPRFGSIG
jgi:hypothetical protein